MRRKLKWRIRLWAMERNGIQGPDPPRAGGSATRKCKSPGQSEHQCLVDDIQEWYYSTENKSQMEKTAKAFATRPTLQKRESRPPKRAKAPEKAKSSAA